MAGVHQVVDGAPIVSAMKFDMHGRRVPDHSAERSDDRNLRSFGIDLDQVEASWAQPGDKSSGISELDWNRRGSCIWVLGNRADHGITGRIERLLAIALIKTDFVNVAISDTRRVLDEKTQRNGIGFHAVDEGIWVGQAKIRRGKADVGADIEHRARRWNAGYRLVAQALEDLPGDVPDALFIGNDQIDHAVVRAHGKRQDGGRVLALALLSGRIACHLHPWSAFQAATQVKAHHKFPTERVYNCRGSGVRRNSETTP